MQFLEIEVENLDGSYQSINRVTIQLCGSSAYSKRKEQFTGLQREPQKILNTEKHGDVKKKYQSGHKIQTANDIRKSKIENWCWFSRGKYRSKQWQSYSAKVKLSKMKKLKSNGQKEGTHSGNIIKIQRNGSWRPFLCMSNLSSMSLWKVSSAFWGKYKK